MIYNSLDIEQNILKLVTLGYFLPFYPLKNPNIKILKNEKNLLLYHHFTHVYQKSQLYDVWFLRYGKRQTEFFVILGDFLPFYHLIPITPNDPKNQNFEKKITKCLEVLSFYTYMCTINENHMIYGF